MVKDLKMLVWMTQLGLSVAIPPAGFILLALWLRDSCRWGNWVIWVGVGLGAFGAIQGFHSSLKTMERMATEKEKESKPRGFNEHE